MVRTSPTQRAEVGKPLPLRSLNLIVLERGDCMSEYRIICIVEATVERPVVHTHITGVGTGPDVAKMEKKWSLTDVTKAIQMGDKFYTQGVASRKIASVEIVNCSRCGELTLRSVTGAVPDNELTTLRPCRPQS